LPWQMQTKFSSILMELLQWRPQWVLSLRPIARPRKPRV